jgi:putative radical SAM enzyme (TIGR03279 family)
MALFQEIDPLTFAGGRIVGIEPGSVADELELRPGDELLAINDQAVEDIIDVQFYAAEEEFEMLIRRDGEILLFEVERDYDQSLGLEFAHPTFDVDIRRCNNLCEFCFVLQMGPKYRRTLYIKDDDYRYSFLFGHYVTLTNLSEHDWWRIETMRLSPLYVSVHVTDTDVRRRFLRNPGAGDIMAQLRWLADRHIEVHAQLVIVPGFNDGEWLARSVRELATLWPEDDASGGVLSVSVVPVGLTRHHKYDMRPHTREEAVATLDFVEALQSEFLERFGIRFIYPTDEWYLVTGREVPPLEDYDGHELHENGLGMVRAFLDDWTAVREEIAGAATRPAPRDVTLVTAALFAPTLREKATELAALTGCNVSVVQIRNQRLGETITVAGLLNGSDVLQQLGESAVGELVVLPRVMFDHPDTISLDNISPQDIANQLDRPVALADSLGDVWDALLGQSKVMYRPGVTPAGTIDLKVLGNGANGSAAHFS